MPASKLNNNAPNPNREEQRKDVRYTADRYHRCSECQQIYICDDCTEALHASSGKNSIAVFAQRHKQPVTKTICPDCGGKDAA